MSALEHLGLFGADPSDARQLTPTTCSMLDMIPAWARGDPDIQAAMLAMSNEVDRINQRIQDAIEGYFPQLASTYLYLWEASLGLSQNPEGLTVLQRQQRVLGFLAQRANLSSGASWVQAVTLLLGTGWTYSRYPDENTPRNTLTINVAYVEGSPRASDLIALLQIITPANTELFINYGQGFIIEQSQIQEQIL